MEAAHAGRSEEGEYLTSLHSKRHRSGGAENFRLLCVCVCVCMSACECVSVPCLVLPT